MDWCGQLAEETEVKIPWGMCNGNSANNTINTCNGGDCTSFIEENGQNGRVLVDQPALWTENWMGWFDDWGQSFPAGDWTTFESTEQSASKAYGILRWTARGGSHVNFYNVRPLLIASVRCVFVLWVVCAPERCVCGVCSGLAGITSLGMLEAPWSTTITGKRRSRQTTSRRGRSAGTCLASTRPFAQSPQ